jgi:Uma2 family endonuclease
MAVRKLTHLPHYTYSDYKQWEGRWELINGVPYAMSPLPSLNHQRASSNIDVHLKNLLRKCNRCEAFIPIDWKVSEDTVVQPDNVVLCYKAGGNFITKAPTLIFEILSASTGPKDRHDKFELYEMNKVKYYVMVDMDKRICEVYELKKNRYENVKTTGAGKFLFDLKYCKINFNFGKIWPSK